LKRAFTLIELLVVIAIIAILAAILFPVFAQAKSAAKGASSLSNNKQDALAILMYTNDTDDVAVLDIAWGGGYPVWYGVQWSDNGPWCYLINPYMKNSHIVEDPLGPSEAKTGWGAGFQDLYNLYENNAYGYDYTVFSPSYWGNNDVHGNMNRYPISMTSPARIADTVLLTQHLGQGEPGYSWWYGSGTLVTNYESEAVDCNDIPPACMVNWGLGSWIAGLGATYVEGGQTGMNAPRRADHIIASFGDGHAKATSTGALATGTNWNPTINNSAITITNLGIYHWTAM
jgi:prepilin-type N-terminal cleavage/methylation domain-containing protein